MFKKKFYQEIANKIGTMEVSKRTIVEAGLVHPKAITKDINEKDASFWEMFKDAWEPAFTEEAVKKGFEMQ